MQDKKDSTEKLRKIIEALPKLNCGQCGFDNCGKFAVGVVEGKTSPFECRQDPSVGYRIAEIMGMKIPEETKIQASYPKLPLPKTSEGGMGFRGGTSRRGGGSGRRKGKGRHAGW